MPSNARTLPTSADLAAPVRSFIHLAAHDNIVVATQPLEAGTELVIEGRSIRLTEPIRMGHKVSAAAIGKGEPILKYGQTIGFATANIPPGTWVHTHNVGLADFQRDYAACQHIPAPPIPIFDRTFQGFRRANGKAGTRNYLAIISNVNCSASVAKYIAARFATGLQHDFPNIDGVVAFKHEWGCAMQFGGSAHEMLNRVLAGIARHPNIGGYLLVGLGCEQGALGYLVDSQRLVQIQGLAHVDTTRPPMLSIQDCGGTAATVEAGVKAVRQLLPHVNSFRRESIPASELMLGTECGGSDGSSGITANPAVGVASDMIVAAGGTAILSETPEIFGAEHLLTRRARSPEVAEKLLERIRWWQWYTGLFGDQLDSNPSVGNKEGGLTTIAEKSLGAVAKGGSTAMEDVYQYAEPVHAKGFVVMDSPGYDPPSVTGMVAGGANVVVFTTGRGSCFGCKPTPSIKIATNTPMYERMEADMDINAGTILEGKETVQQVGQRIFEEILAVAGGKKTKSEAQGIGDEEFVPWVVGPVM